MRQLLIKLMRGDYPDLLDHVAPPVELEQLGSCVPLRTPKLWDGDTLQDVHAAQAICAACPVREMCLEWGTAHEPYGIWGGATPKQRAKLRGSAPLVTVQELNYVRELRHDLTSTKTAKHLSEKYGTSERQIYRWKESVA